jgi:hypothetical protein
VELGGLSSYLQWAATPGAKLHGPGYILNCVERFVGLLGAHGFVVTNRASNGLREFRKERLESNPDAQLNQQDAKQLAELLQKIQSTLFAEAEGHISYVATDKRYAAEKLSDDVWSLFGAGVKGRMPEVAISDIEDAGKCVLFERSTAGAFHLMRAAEAILRLYFEVKVGRPHQGEMWARMVEELRKSPSADAQVLDHIDNIRKNFRNPTQHPEKLYDLEEVQDLFGVCIDIINRMAKSLPERA